MENQGKKHQGGRPSKFKEEYITQAKKLAILGLIDDDMADVFGVSVRTFNNWKKDYPAFAEALNTGKRVADAEVAHSLFQRATGYSHEAVKIMQYEGVPVTEKYTEHYPPDPVACIFWLKNRQPKLWRDKVDPTDGNDETPPPVKVVINVVDASQPEPVEATK